MKVFIVYKEDYPWDVRVEKLALSLASSGLETTIISSNNSCKNTNEHKDGYSIIRLPGFKLLPRFFRKVLNFPLWFNPIWFFSLLKITKNKSNSILIIRDLPLVKLGIIIGKIRKQKVIYDMAEVYPEMYRSLNTYAKPSKINRIIKNPSLAERYEKNIIFKVDHIFTMIGESRDRLINLGVDPRNVSIVSNTPPKNKFGNEIFHHEMYSLRIVYVGFLTKIRGLDLLVKAIDKYISMGNPRSSISFDIVGKGQEKKQLEKLILSLNLSDIIRVHGWLDKNEVEDLLAQANVGALTYRVCGHWNHTIPNKIFDYMLLGIPVLTTPVIPIKRIVQETQCGLVADEASPYAIANCLASLRDPSVRQTFGNNGNSAVLRKYNWSQDSKTLKTVVESLLDQSQDSMKGRSTELG